MSGSGQKAKYSLRAHIVRFAPDSGLNSDLAGGSFRAAPEGPEIKLAGCPKWPGTGVGAPQLTIRRTADVRQKPDQSNHRDRDSCFRGQRLRARKCRHWKYVHRHRTADGAGRTGKPKRRLDPTARSRHEHHQDQYRSHSRTEKRHATAERAGLSEMKGAAGTVQLS